MKKILFPLLLLSCALNAFSQPAPYTSKITFMLSFEPSGWPSATMEDLLKKDVHFLIPSWDGGAKPKLEYDAKTNAVTMYTYGFERQDFFIVYRKDTVRVTYPAVKWMPFNLLQPIPLTGKSYNFYSSILYTAIHSNVARQSPDCHLETFNFCLGCFISEYEDTTVKEIPKNLVEVKI